MADSQVNLDQVFDQIDTDGSGEMSTEELRQALLTVGMDEHTYNDILAHADANKDGSISREEFFKAMSALNDEQGHTGELNQLVKKTKEILTVKTASGGAHSYSTEEVSAFADHINNVLGDDPQLEYLLPLNSDNDDLFKKIEDGVLLAKFVNCIKENTIDMRALNFPQKKGWNTFKARENLNLAINACKSVGVIVHNIGAGDIEKVENPILALGLLWQMVKMHLLSDINLKDHPELLRLLLEGETMEDLLKMRPEDILKRWMNYHLKEAGSARRVDNFSGDVKDSEAYTIVMNRINPNKCNKDALNESSKTKRAKMVLDNARELGCKPFIKPKDIASGNHKLNLAFVADLFNTAPGLDPIEEEALKDLFGMFDDDQGDSREERAFRMWCNTLGIDNFYLNNLFDDFEDGLNLLKVIDAVEPGTVNWRKVEKKPKNVFKKNSNNSYAVVLGKSMGFSLVGIGGGDITSKNKKLVLAFVWQLFRYHSLKFLKELGADVTDDKILEFSNAQVERVGGTAVKSFGDGSLSTGIYCCDLVKSIDPDVFDTEYVSAGNTEEDAILNARYAISVARRHNLCIFCLPEDIYEVKKKMILVFAAAVMKHKSC